MSYRLLRVMSGALVIICAGAPGSASVVTRTTPSALTFGPIKQPAQTGGGAHRYVRLTKSHQILTVARPPGCLANGTFSFVGGGQRNHAGGGTAVSGDAGILAGFGNEACDLDSAIGAGKLNVVGGDGKSNLSVVAGGELNAIEGYEGFIGAGNSNGLGLSQASVYTNVNYSAIVGGQQNTVGSPLSFVGAGYANSIVEDGGTFTGPVKFGQSAFIGAGVKNTVTGNFAGIVAGSSNEVDGYDSAIAGGDGNFIDGLGNYSSIVGGKSNSLRGEFNAIAGGDNNYSSANYSFIGGGEQNAIAGDRASGVDDYAVISGGSSNSVSTSQYGPAVNVTIGGGSKNTVSFSYGTIAGGDSNSIVSSTGLPQYATIGGGLQNSAGGGAATIGGGSRNSAGGGAAAIGGGDGNSANGNFAAITGGHGNFAPGYSAAVGGGSGNNASGLHAAIPGGQTNRAGGTNSFAAGTSSNAANAGTFVWSDDATGAKVLASTASNQFLARAAGGFYLYSAANLSTGVKLAPGSGSWSTLSDRAAKTAIEDVDDARILASVAALPVSEWSYSAQGAAIRHLGPMAQDFRAAFGLGEDDRHIAAVDEEGVALAAIKALGAELTEKDRKLNDLDAKYAHLEQRLEALEAHLQTTRRRSGTRLRRERD